MRLPKRADEIDAIDVRWDETSTKRRGAAFAGRRSVLSRSRASGITPKHPRAWQRSTSPTIEFDVSSRDDVAIVFHDETLGTTNGSGRVGETDFSTISVSIRLLVRRVVRGPRGTDARGGPRSAGGPRDAQHRAQA
jgi:hypothetical protein